MRVIDSLRTIISNDPIPSAKPDIALAVLEGTIGLSDLYRSDLVDGAQRDIAWLDIDREGLRRVRSGLGGGRNTGEQTR